MELQLQQACRLLCSFRLHSLMALLVNILQITLTTFIQQCSFF